MCNKCLKYDSGSETGGESDDDDACGGREQRTQPNRWRPEPWQVDILERQWIINQMPDANEKRALELRLSGTVTERQIVVWFQNRRRRRYRKMETAWQTNM